ncbi:histone-lysine N-methyltransferase SETMAR [Nephila pilipes]|uniref:Histone-lysine N-methyltransferase SETMAR n=1 Tax=Nephila pilipes TaxID=299642 RepID=A0A8X6T2E8_NEPPI|nr:histone-lysine N-methyltransferase SETMAR [Nephila pilipes]
MPWHPNFPDPNLIENVQDVTEPLLRTRKPLPRNIEELRDRCEISSKICLRLSSKSMWHPCQGGMQLLSVPKPEQHGIRYGNSVSGGLKTGRSRVGKSVVIKASPPHTFIIRNLYSAKRNVSKDLARCCLFCDLKVGLSEAASSRQICRAFGDSTVNERTARHWFKKFRSGDLSLCEEPNSGRPHALDNESLSAAIEENSSLAKQFNVSDKIVRLHLHW